MNRKLFKKTMALLLAACAIFASACAPAGKPADEAETPGEREAEEDRGAWASYPMGVFYNGMLYFLPESEEPSDGSMIGMQSAKKTLTAAELGTGEAFPLCGKPDCTHGVSEGCNAVLEGCDMGVFTLYRDKLYWVAWIGQKHFLYSANLDGSEHTRVMELDHELEMQMGGGLIRIYNDRLYRLGVGSGVEAGEPKRTVTLYEQPIGEGEPTVLLRHEEDANVMMKLASGTLYCAIQSTDAENRLTLAAYDAVNGGLETLFCGAAPCSWGDMLVTREGKSILFSGGPKLCEFSLEERSFKTLLDTADAPFAADDTLFSMVSQTGFRCKDFAGNTVFEGELEAEGFAPEGEYFKRYIGFYDGAFYLNTSPLEGGWYVLRIDPHKKSVALVCGEG